MYAMLAEYGGHMRPDDEVLVQDLNDAIVNCSHEMHAAGTFLSEAKASNVAKLKAGVATLLAAVKEISEECSSGQFDSISRDSDEVRGTLAAFSEQVSLPVPACRSLHVGERAARVWPQACVASNATCGQPVELQTCL
jgi:hypothetical protein